MSVESKNKESKFSIWSIILEDKEIDFDLFLSKIVDFQKCSYWCICHDSDITEEGELKRKHYHLIIYFHNKFKIRKSTLLNRLVDFYQSEKELITLENGNSLNALIRYLTHVDYPLKFQYSKDLIKTNDLRLLNKALRNELEEMENLSANELIDLCYDFPNRLDILKIIGLNNYVRYGRVIDMILNELILLEVEPPSSSKDINIDI